MDELDRIINQYNKKSKGSIIQLDECANQKVQRVKTGSFALDIGVGGGYPYGSIIELFGEESTGKSLSALKTVCESQREGRKCVYIDLEGSITLEWAVKVGVDPKMLYIARPKTAEEALQMVEDLASSKEVGVIVIDSVAALVPVVEAENDIGTQQMGTAAKLMSKHLRGLTSVLQPEDMSSKDDYNPCVVVYINQTREKIGVVYGSPLTTPGGKALKFYATIRVHFKNSEYLYDLKKAIIGKEIKYQIKKNKSYIPGQVGAFNFYYDGRIDDEASVVQYAIVYELIKQGGAWFYFGEEKFQGKEKLTEYLKAKPKVLTKLKTDILKILSK